MCCGDDEATSPESTVTRRWQVIIVGDGAAGVAAAFPLVERGVEVLMLGGAPRDVEPPLEAGSLADVRRDAGQWRMLIGERYEALDDTASVSPKFRAPRYSALFRGFNERYRVRTRNFNSVGTLAGGGLSTAWGAGVSIYDDADLAEYPLALRDLLPSYRRVSERIGVSGVNDDDLAAALGHDEHLLPPTELHDNAQALLSRYHRNRRHARARGVLLGRGRNAVLTRDLGERNGCVYCGRCLWGCPRNAIWAASYDLPTLKRHANFRHVAGRFATALVKRADGWRVVAENGDSTSAAHFDGERVLLACGAIGSAKLVLDALDRRDEDVPLQTCPVANFALLVLRPRPQPLADDRLFALSQLCFQVSEPRLRGGYAIGHFFPAQGVPAGDLVRNAGFSYPLSRRVMRRLQPLLLVGTCFFDAAYTRHTLRLTGAGEVAIVGRFAEDLAGHAALVRNALAGTFRRYGALLPARGFRLGEPGADIHYGGSVPMRPSPAPGEANDLGEVRGLPGVHVVDGASLTHLAAKPHTLTLMANADRIGTHLAGAQSHGAPPAPRRADCA